MLPYEQYCKSQSAMGSINKCITKKKKHKKKNESDKKMDYSTTCYSDLTDTLTV